MTTHQTRTWNVSQYYERLLPSQTGNRNYASNRMMNHFLQHFFLPLWRVLTRGLTRSIRHWQQLHKQRQYGVKNLNPSCHELCIYYLDCGTVIQFLFLIWKKNFFFFKRLAFDHKSKMIRLLMSVLQKRFLSSQTKITYPPTESREKPVNGSIKKRNKIRSPVS